MTEQGIVYKPSGHQKILKLSDIKVNLGEYLDWDVATATLIAPVDSSGDANGGPVLWHEVDNSGGSAGDKKVLIDSGGAICRMEMELVDPDTGGTVELASGGSGSVDTITADGVEILKGAVAFNSDLNDTAADVAAQINANNTRFYATVSTDTVTIRERVVTKSAFTVASTSSTIVTNDVNASGGEAVEEGIEGDDVYANGKREVGLSGTRAIGTVDKVFGFDNDTVEEATAGKGTIEIDGTSGSITDIEAASTSLLGSSVSWTTSNENTAELVAAEINDGIGTHKYFAEADGAKVHIYQTSATLDEDTVTITPSGSDIVTVIADIHGGIKPRILVKLKAFAE